MARKNRRLPPGDIRMKPADGDYAEQPLNEQERALVRRAYQLFDFFREKLAESHDEMRKARMMRQLRQEERAVTSPPSNTLNSCIDNVIADQIDNMPEAKMVPEREETANSAEEMTDVVSYALYQANWADTYHEIMEDSAVTGTGITQTFWDEDMEDGAGMVNVIPWHPEDFYPDPACEDLQDGRAVFKATQTTVAWVEEHYPDARGYVRADLASQEYNETQYDAPEGDVKTTLLEYWYKRYDAKKRKYRVHMAKLAGRALLYSTELAFGPDSDGFKEGVYAHGRYPFTMYKYRRVWKQPFGTGLVHDYRETQNTIDRYLKYIDDNARSSSLQRHFIRKGSGVNPDDVADMRKTIIEWEGDDIRNVMQTVQASPLNAQVYTTMDYLVSQMKQDSGQNSFNRGEGGHGVTAASAIEALQEAGSKITRMHTESYKAAFREMVEQIMWVMSEYLEPGRKLRIVGGWDSTGNMKDRLVEVNAPNKEGDKLPRPAYTVRVQVQRNNPLQLQAANEFVGQVQQYCAQAGEPLPAEAVISLMQGIPTKTSVLKVVQANSKQLAYIQQLEQQLQATGEQLEAQKKANAGYAKMLSSAGGQPDAELESAAQQLVRSGSEPAANQNAISQAASAV